MDRKLLHMGSNSQQIASHRQTHTYRAVPLNILREGGLSFRVTTPSGIPVVALKKIIKKYPPGNGKKILFSLRIINGTSLIIASWEFESSHWWHPHCIFSAGTRSRSICVQWKQCTSRMRSQLQMSNDKHTMKPLSC